MSSYSPSILYIHGLNSSPVSQKASQLSAALEKLGMAERLRVPALHHHPRQAIAQLEACLTELGRPLLVIEPAALETYLSGVAARLQSVTTGVPRSRRSGRSAL